MWLQLRTVLHHDPAWLIHGTEVFLGGGRLYQDVFEVNPPLIFYLTVPPVWLAGRLNLFDIDVFVIYVFALSAISLGLAWAVLGRESGLPRGIRAGLVPAATFALIVCPAERFGQREHLMVILALPYLLLIAARARRVGCSRGLAIPIGLLAGFGFALKPHFLLVPLAMECWLALRSGAWRRALRPETVALAAVVLVYGLAIAVFTPGYLTVIIPFAISVYGAGYGTTLPMVLLQGETLLLPAIVLIHLAVRRHQRAPEAGDVLAIAACCFFVAYLMQMKGWRYHLYPVDAALFLLLASDVLQGLAAGAAAPRLTGALGGLLAVLAADAGIGRYQASFRADNSFMTEMAPFVREVPPGSDIYVFAAGVFNGFPLVNYHRLGWSSRFDTLWLLPGLVAQTRPSPRIERFLREAVVEDLTKRPPALVFVDVARTKLRFGTRDFDYIRYFSADPRFAALWAGYEEIARVGEFLVFRRAARAGGP